MGYSGRAGADLLGVPRKATSERGLCLLRGKGSRCDDEGKVKIKHISNQALEVFHLKERVLMGKGSNKWILGGKEVEGMMRGSLLRTSPPENMVRGGNCRTGGRVFPRIGCWKQEEDYQKGAEKAKDPSIRGKK